MPHSALTKIAALLGFQLAWFVTAFSVTAKRPILGVAMSVAVFAAHFLARRARLRLTALAVVGGALGYVADSILVLAGLLTFEVAAPSARGVPLWMVLLWSNFALTVDAMPKWITSRLALTALTGAIGAPISYVAGEKFDALLLSAPRTISIAAVAVEWGVAVPLFVVIDRLLTLRSAAEMPDSGQPSEGAALR